MKKWFYSILEWLHLKKKDKESVIKQAVYPTKPSEIKGYGPCNAWYLIDAADLADRLVAAGCNTTMVEFLGWAEAGKYEDINSLAEPWRKFVTEMRKRRILIYCTIVNWNKGKNSSSGESICSSKYSLDWFKGVYNMVTQHGTEGICLEACSEWDDANKNCTAKALQFIAHVDQNWSGIKGWNRGSRPNTSPTGYWLNYHINHAKAEGPAGCLCLTDTSTVLREINAGGDLMGFADPSKLELCARLVKHSGRGFLYYGFGHKSIDVGAIGALSKV